LQNGVDPADTLDEIGGVGGALAGEAQRLYESLSSEEQAIARSIFLALVQVSEDSGDTRRRAAVSELIATDADENRVWSIINRFAEPRVRFLVIFSDKQYGEMIEMIEVAHEALIRNWQQLKDWLNECRESLRKKRKIEDAAEEWKFQKKSKDYLLEGRSLRDAKEFMQAANKEIALSSLAVEFVKAGIKQKKSNILKFASVFIVFPLIGTLITVHLQIISRANLILSRDDCKPDSGIKGLLEYMWWTKNANRLTDLKLCKENLRGIKLPEVVITNSDFKNANLSNIDFHKVTIINSNFRGATIAYTNFSNAWLAESDFQCSDTGCTILLGTNFQNAKLQKVKLQNAVLANVNFRGADLTNANLDGAEGLTAEQLKTAILCQTIMPKYITISGTRDCPDELP
jgi:hypothetical protein